MKFSVKPAQKKYFGSGNGKFKILKTMCLTKKNNSGFWIRNYLFAPALAQTSVGILAPATVSDPIEFGKIKKQEVKHRILKISLTRSHTSLNS